MSIRMECGSKRHVSQAGNSSFNECTYFLRFSFILWVGQKEVYFITCLNKIMHALNFNLIFFLHLTF